MLAAKSRVAPVKRCTIPRLELLAAVIGARLAYDIKQEFKTATCFYWSDSMTTISWIRREEAWGIFVRNRVNEIQKLSDRNDWRHVPGNMNPADLASRGCLPKFLVESKWWEGPAWLMQPSEEWLASEEITNEEEVKAEIKKTSVVGVNVDSDSFLKTLSHRFSSYYRIVKLVAWIIRFRNNCKQKEKTVNLLSVSEIKYAEEKLLRLIQEEAFSGPKDVRLSKLKIFKDDDGLLRVSTKIVQRNDFRNFGEPIVLPSDHVIVERLILQEHYDSGHSVAQALVSRLRENYWVLRSRQTVRRIVNGCVVCKRYSSKCFEVETPALPEARVKDAKIFEVTGTDFAGPLYLKNGEKVWICIFTCTIYRAIHLDCRQKL